MHENEEQPAVILASFPEHESLEITRVKALQGWRNKHRYEISFSEYRLEVHESTMLKFRMLKGSFFTKAELLEVIGADEKQQAYAAGLAYLSRKPRTRWEMETKLRDKGWSEWVAEQTADRLEQEGYLNDAEYAKEWTRQSLEGKGKGSKWVRQELRQKGIAKLHIEAAMAEVSEQAEFEQALGLAEKRCRRSLCQEREEQRKLAAFLMRRGFSGSVVSRVIRSLARTANWEEAEDVFF